MNLPFPLFEPDRSIYTGGQTLINVVPVADGWGPLPQLVVDSDPLPAACLGAWYMRTSAGAFRIFAGTQTKIYEYNLADKDWDDISDGNTFAVPDGDEWQAVRFGSVLLFTNMTDGLWYIDADSGTVVAKIADAPHAKYIGTAGDFVVLGHLATNANMIHTSERNDAQGWTVGKNGCDFQAFPTGEEVQGILSAEKGAVIAQRTALRTMTVLVDGAYSFRTDEINNARGVISPLSLALIAPGVFVYYSTDGFMMGMEGKPIGEGRLDAWFDGEADRSLLHTIKAMVDPYQKIVWFRAERADGTKFRIGYKWPLDRWCYSDVNVTAMAALVTPSVSIDGLDALYATIDDVDLPFDSRLLSGGVQTMVFFNGDNELCYLTGTPEAATLQTIDAELSPGTRSYVSEAMVAGDCASYAMRAVTSDRFGGARTVGSPVSPNTSTGICHLRSDARFHAFRATIPAGTEWTRVIGVQNIRKDASGRR